MNIFGEWIYWLQFLGIVVAVIVLMAVAIGVFGWDRVKAFVLPVLGLLAVFGYRAKLQQQGYRDRRAEEEKALDIAEDFVEDKRDEVQKLPDVELDEKVDRWSRKS